MGRRLTGREALFRGLHLAALAFFVLAWPLLDLLGRNPEFFVVRGSSPADVVVLALVLSLVPPLVLLGLEALVALASRRAAAALHLLFVGVLAGMFALLVLGWIGAPSAVALLAPVIGLAAALAYRAFGPVRSVATLLALAPPVFLGLFFFHSPTGELVLPQSDVRAADVKVGKPASVVFLVLDEFPTLSLLGPDGRIDAARFPHFARLARESTWYQNATTVDPNTSRAVPVILTGRNDGGAAIAEDHPQNLFTLLGGTYGIQAAEAVTRLCPDALCPRGTAEPFATRMRSLGDDVGVVYLHELLPDTLRSRLPSISSVWGDFTTSEERPAAQGLGPNFVLRNLLRGSMREREAAFEAFVRAVRPTRRPTLFFLHSLLPHYPWEHTPSGRTYEGTTNPGLTADFWTGDTFQAQQAWQRHLEQVGYVDGLLGKLVARLRSTGLWKRALVVVVADHGTAFLAGEPRKLVTDATAVDLAYVPLFVKAPGQRQGRTVDATVSTLDVLPTVADLLAIRLTWAVQGHSLARDTAPARTVALDAADGTLAVPADELLHRRAERLALQTRLFGRTWADLQRFGERPGLLGRPVVSLPRAPEVRAVLDPQPWTASTERVPAFVRGSVVGSGATGATVAVAVNGHVAAVVPTTQGTDGVRFSALLPENAFRRGANDVRAVPVRAR